MNRITWTPTSLEQKLIDALEGVGLKRNKDYSFQHPTRSGFIIDFAFTEIKLAVEVDGPHHQTRRQRKHDCFRDKMLRREGWKVIRFTQNEIENRMGDVILTITKYLRYKK